MVREAIMRVSLKGSKGTTLEISATCWRDALNAAAKNGWKRNCSPLGMNTIQASDSTKLSKALRQAGRNGYGERFIYSSDFLQDNAITVE